MVAMSGRLSAVEAADTAADFRPVFSTPENLTNKSLGLIPVSCAALAAVATLLVSRRSAAGMPAISP